MSPPDHNALECLMQVPNVWDVPYPAPLSLEGLSLGGHCGSPNQPLVSQRGRGTSPGTSHSCAHRLWLFAAAKQTDPAAN